MTLAPLESPFLALQDTCYCYVVPFEIIEMRKEERDAVAKKVVKKYKKLGKEKVKDVVKIFVEAGYVRRTIEGMIKRYETTGNIVAKSPPGRKKNTRLITKVSKLLEKKPSTSLRNGCSAVGTSKTTFQRIKTKELNRKSYVKVTVPEITPKQATKAKKNIKKIYEKVNNNKMIIVMDDETYVPKDPKNVPGREFYSATSRTGLPLSQRIKTKTKYPGKFMIWQAIDENGNISKPFVTDKSMNWQVYLVCLRQFLFPFIRKHQTGTPVLFWPDMATCHYKKEVLDELRAKNINFVEKIDNAPAVPHLQPIEKFWALCKAEYKKETSPANTIKEMEKVWSKISKRVAKKSGQALFERIRGKLRLTSRKGVYAVLDK
uniref:DDE_3 domain-containing protein n=1 Tax=Rhabditophanes sp. KR3021 TaxID=114890 RepID=A0AC35TPZ9_9BILA